MAMILVARVLMKGAYRAEAHSLSHRTESDGSGV